MVDYSDCCGGGVGGAEGLNDGVEERWEAEDGVGEDIKKGREDEKSNWIVGRCWMDGMTVVC